MGIVDGFEVRRIDQTAGDGGMNHVRSRHRKRRTVISRGTESRPDDESEKGDKSPGRGSARRKEAVHGSPAGGVSCIWITHVLCCSREAF